jgi:cytidylate kinase
MNILQKAYDKNQEFIIALDGPSAAGKGLIGQLLAEEFTLAYFQSSLVYRGLAYICLQNNIDVSLPQLVTETAQNTDIFSRIKDVDLNTEKIGDLTSKISVIPEVREELGRYLKEIIQNNRRVVMEGRDIGTVIAPKADLKLFITAPVNIRAKRRYKQLILQGKECILCDVLTMLKSRDERDRSRSFGPLAQAKDAYVIDTGDLEPKQVIQQVKDIINKSSKCH